MWARWAVEPVQAAKLLVAPLLGSAVWSLASPTRPNPFSAFYTISNRVDGTRYAKSWLDLVFVAYYVVFFSWFRQIVVVSIGRRAALYLGVRKRGKVVRFGEQTYAFVYYSIASAWGLHVMRELPTWWYHTAAFWLEYPHWAMTPQLKAYYLVQAAYWIQQVLVLLLHLERPRKDHNEFVVHHCVTIWLIGWSYLMNLTLIGHAVYLSMDVPEVFFSFSKLLNYLAMDRAKIVSLAIFTYVWTYFRHYLNILILWSVYSEYDLVPASARRWSPADGTYLTWWLKYWILAPLAALQLLNMFWYALVLRILVKALLTAEADDERSDDEDEGA
ncbi:Longevity assurance proteins LAG1/LAC1 [Mycena indigotica]|uniref:Longevity assurance proteins LAG1/LAC1 n=1 Tax=Mycena indigotica TaxID=2126181 RepID=A0A8H6WKW2_9AGAR|nr:Longevity assurance proteins LAG1/LAC1 [Mycena indigotica]KAF7316164.1 Longevity assurance proteins LAG1/LAC1 [Mycena indigotica]